MDGYVSKPIHSASLAAEISRVIPDHLQDPERLSIVIASAIPEETILDAPDFLSRVGGKREALGEVIDLFLGDYPERVDEMRRAMTAHDLRAVQRAAHNMKGSTANIGARKAWQAAQAVETAAKAGNEAGVHAAVQRLDGDLQQLALALIALKETGR